MPLLLYSNGNYERKEGFGYEFQSEKIIMTALFAALACVATMSIRIPTPGTGGYIHPGDAIVILAGIILRSCIWYACRWYRFCTV